MTYSDTTPETTETHSRRVLINAVVQKDGMLRLQVPVDARLAGTLLTVTVQFEEPLSAEGASPAYRDALEQVIGSIDDPTFERPPQPTRPERHFPE
jgi:hypothetical protein